VAQQPNKDDRGGGANLCRKRRSASRLPATANPAGQGSGLFLRNRRTGDGECWEKNTETVRRPGGLCGFRSLRSQADAGVDDERAAQDVFGVRAVIAEDDGKHGRGPRRR